MRILYATDGSEGALAAAELLRHLSLGADDSISVVTVAEDPHSEEARQVLADAVEALRPCSTPVDTRVRSGKPAVEILDVADELDAEMIALGSRGLGAVARFFLGSVAERVARHAPCAVLVARPVIKGLREAILGLDESKSAAYAADWLRRFPLPPDCEVRVVTALPRYRVGPALGARMPGLAAELDAIQVHQRQEAVRQLKELAQVFQQDGRRAASEFRERHPAQGLLEAAEAHTADLIAVGRQGLSGIDRFLMGSVSEHVLRHAPCSVLIIPRRGAPDDEA